VICLQLLDVCAVYGGHVFRLEMATRDFATECRTLISNGKVRRHIICGGIVVELHSSVYVSYLGDDAYSESALFTDQMSFYCKNTDGNKVDTFWGDFSNLGLLHKTASLWLCL